jgi:hypothetical protein
LRVEGKGGSKMANGQASASAQAAPALPDVNIETYPFDVVAHALDQTADFSMLATPVDKHAASATLTPDNPGDFFGINGGYGIDFLCDLHELDAVVSQPTPETGVKVAQTVGEASGSFRSRCLFGPEDFPWAPGQNPSPTIYDPWLSQRFAMVDTEFQFGGDSVHGYGIGRTYPISVAGRPQLLVGAVGNLMDGRGAFEDLEGTYVLAGVITPGLGFTGNITCRPVDFKGAIRRDREPPDVPSIPDPMPGNTFVVFRGTKKDSTIKTTYGPPPDAKRVTLTTPSQMRSVRYGYRSHRGGMWTATREVGPVVAGMDADVYFDLLAPPGTAASPVPFQTKELYTFVDAAGRTIGTLSTAVIDGISFALKFPALPGQPGVRFAGFGPIYGGTGPLAGVQGILTVNSLIGIAPHALSLLHVLYLVDPNGNFRE